LFTGQAKGLSGSVDRQTRGHFHPPLRRRAACGWRNLQAKGDPGPQRLPQMTGTGAVDRLFLR
jgi:hypothetical protein